VDSVEGEGKAGGERRKQPGTQEEPEDTGAALTAVRTRCALGMYGL
jgi:hypothetical protein